MRSRRVLLLGAASAILALVLVAVGRWEEHRSARHEVNEMHVVLGAVGNLNERRPTGYRFGPPNCLAYPTSGNLYGLQICFDSAGRVVETVDRRPTQPKYASLFYDPALSTLRVPLPLIHRLFALPRNASEP